MRCSKISLMICLWGPHHSSPCWLEPLCRRSVSELAQQTLGRLQNVASHQPRLDKYSGTWAHLTRCNAKALRQWTEPNHAMLTTQGNGIAVVILQIAEKPTRQLQVSLDCQRFYSTQVSSVSLRRESQVLSNLTGPLSRKRLLHAGQEDGAL